MKKIIFILVVIFCMTFSACSQTQTQVKKEGNTFSIERIQTQQSLDTVRTVFSYKDSKDNVYPIYLNKKTGSVFIFRTSSKTGKPYKQYMPAEIKKDVHTYYEVKYESTR